MSCGSTTYNSTAIPVTVPALRFVAPEWPALAWRAFVRSALARGLHFAERRSQRLALRALDDRLLADIGISRADAHAEAAKPFWR